MITILPECTLSVFADIVFLAGSASYQLYLLTLVKEYPILAGEKVRQGGRPKVPHLDLFLPFPHRFLEFDLLWI